MIRWPSVSRHHASLAFRTDHYEIADLGSTNGTFVNGERVIGPAIVEIGDELRFGDAKFILAKPVRAGILSAARKPRAPKRILTSRGNFEAVLFAFAIGFAAAQYLAYLLYHAQNRLILAEAVAVNQPARTSTSQAANHLAGPGTLQRTETPAAAAPKVVARAAGPVPATALNSETIAARELAGGVALAQLIVGSGTEVGHPAPDFTLPKLDGSDMALGTMRGKIVLLNFWATWCGACRSEMPSLEKLYQNFRSIHHFTLLTVSIDQQGKLAVAQFMSTGRYDFPVLLDTSNSVSADYGVSGIPSTFVIGRDGRIIWNGVGALDWSNPTLRAALRKLL